MCYNSAIFIIVNIVTSYNSDAILRVIVHAVTIDYSIMIICSKWSKLEKKNALLATLFNLKLKTTREY